MFSYYIYISPAISETASWFTVLLKWLAENLINGGLLVCAIFALRSWRKELKAHQDLKLQEKAQAIIHTAKRLCVYINNIRENKCPPLEVKNGNVLYNESLQPQIDPKKIFETLEILKADILNELDNLQNWIFISSNGTKAAVNLQNDVHSFIRVTNEFTEEYRNQFLKEDFNAQIRYLDRTNPANVDDFNFKLASQLKSLRDVTLKAYLNPKT